MTTRYGDNKRFSSIAVHNQTAYFAGQVSQLKEGDITAQSKDVFEKLDGLLAEVNSQRSDVLSVQIWLADMADYDAMNAVWDEWIDSNAPPVRVCVEARMAQPHYKVEILAIAATRQ